MTTLIRPGSPVRRHSRLAVMIAALLAPWSLGAAFAADSFIAYVGTYTSGESKGIYAYRYDAKSGELSRLGLAAATANPSFIAIDPRGRFLYAVNESDEYQTPTSGGVSAFAIEARTGKLTFLNEVRSGGASPCYIALDKSGRFVLVANYGGGSVAVISVSPQGSLGEPSAFVHHASAKFEQARPPEPHAHWIEVTTDNRYAIAADLGLDVLLVYRFDASKGSLVAHTPPFTLLERGAGPRHVAFHPNGRFAYVINELNSTVTSLSYDSRQGTLRVLQSISTLPARFAGENSTAEIAVHPTGRFVYASNRGHDSIAVLAVNQREGTLSLVETVPAGGRTPRSFAIDPTGTRLFAANEDSGNIVVFQVDFATGQLRRSGEVLRVPSPVCIKFLALQQP